jgi:transcription termination/antitermination protein NusG
MHSSEEFFREGEVVRIREGAFASFTGIVREVDGVNLLLKVAVKIFGRVEPIELKYSDVEKIKFTNQ